MYLKIAIIIFVLFALLSGFSSSASAREKLFGFEAREFADSRGNLPYRLFIPKQYDNKKKYPLVLWLHGGAGRGTDNQRQISGGNRIGSTVWTQPDNQEKNPAFVVAPQLPHSSRRSRIDTVKNLQTVVRLIESVLKKYSIDRNRIYVAGQSFGGYGSWWMITHNPDLFAAAIPLCGGGEPSIAANIGNTAVWAFHGALDRTVPVERSREMISAIQKAGRKPKYTEYKDLGHVIWNRVFTNQILIDWLFKQRRKNK